MDTPLTQVSLLQHCDRRGFVVLGACWATAGLARAQAQTVASPAASKAPSPSQKPTSLPVPIGPVLLKVTGNISRRNSGNAALLDATMIDALTQQKFKTQTPWHRGTVQFEGPLLADVLALVGAQGQSLHLTAINDFTATMPATDPRQYGVLLAHSVDGKRLAVRDKGPLFVIYPFDQNPQLRSSVYYARSVWQLSHIDVR
jgi:hypothetical protein